jgi:DNA repair protein RecO (recombination protein O)
MAGIFVTIIPSHPHFLGREESAVFSLLLNMTYEKSSEIRIDPEIRNILTDRMLEYFGLHLGSKINSKSLDVLREILH